MSESDHCVVNCIPSGLSKNLIFFCKKKWFNDLVKQNIILSKPWPMGQVIGLNEPFPHVSSGHCSGKAPFLCRSAGRDALDSRIYACHTQKALQLAAGHRHNCPEHPWQLICVKMELFLETLLRMEKGFLTHSSYQFGIHCFKAWNCKGCFPNNHIVQWAAVQSFWKKIFYYWTPTVMLSGYDNLIYFLAETVLIFNCIRIIKLCDTYFLNDLCFAFPCCEGSVACHTAF